ncbi:MAG: ATP-binding cassette domain-containing protein [Planctomycetes bacterium]|nr:ATP-binding cassette domain-containing protein [Planctomycetota bacterium]
MSIVCALLVAVLFSVSIGSILPLMKVMLEDEGPHDWVYRGMIEARLGVEFEPIPLSEETAAGLTVLSVAKGSVGEAAGILINDVVLSVNQIQNTEFSILNKGEGGEIVDDVGIIDFLARAPTGAQVQLSVRSGQGPVREVVVGCGAKPMYAGAAQWLLGFVPRERGAEFVSRSMMFLILFMLIVTVLRCFLRFVQEYLVRRVSFRSLMHLRKDAFHTAVRLPLSYYDQEGVSDTMSRLVQDSNRIHLGIVTLLGRTVREPMKIIMMLAGALWINAKITLLVVVAAPVVLWVIGRLGKKMRKATIRMLENWSRVLGRVQESLSGIRVVKACHRERWEDDHFDQANRGLLKYQFRMAKVSAASGPLLEVLGMMAACAGMLVAVRWLAAETMSIAEFFTLLGFLAGMGECGRKLGNVITRIHVANAAAERVFKLVDAPAEVDEPGAVRLERLSQSLEFRGVSFQYAKSSEWALRDINFRIEAGQRVAFVGPNGSGKTTLMNLVCRFFDPQEGEILVDGTDISGVTLESLRGQIGLVPQQVVVFNDTIRSNIAYGDLEVNDEAVVRAAKDSFAHEFIETLPEGYETAIGEQGISLSGGQLQRLMIAQAMLRNPAILIFDEAMSQVDFESEEKIHRAISKFSKGRTSLIIAHRFNTVVEADSIVVLDKGRVVDQGKHAELLERCDVYRQLAQRQAAGIA